MRGAAQDRAASHVASERTRVAFVDFKLRSIFSARASP
jgi:hypothetical protein